MKRYRVILLGRAKREYTIEIVWWRLHRQAAPTLLRDEFVAARKLLATTPEAGSEYETDDGRKVRRYLLKESRYWVYHRVDHEARALQFLSLWHTSKPPPAL